MNTQPKKPINNRNNKNRYIQRIKIAQNQLMLDDITYRTMLKRLTGKDSSTKCTIPELFKVMEEMKSKGADIFTGSSLNKHYLKPKSNITRKIIWLWLELGKVGAIKEANIENLNKFVRRIYSKMGMVIPFNIECLDDMDASMILEMMKKWASRYEIKLHD